MTITKTAAIQMLKALLVKLASDRIEIDRVDLHHEIAKDSPRPDAAGEWWAVYHHAGRHRLTLEWETLPEPEDAPPTESTPETQAREPDPAVAVLLTSALTRALCGEFSKLLRQAKRERLAEQRDRPGDKEK